MSARLVRVDNGNQHPKSDLNIEIAHVATDEPKYHVELSNALVKSRNILSGLNVEKYKFRVCYCILVDDKRERNFNRDDWFRSVIQHFPEFVTLIDYVTFESDLKNMLNTFYARLRADKQSTVKNDIERYLSKRKRTACSHDIALWHSLRLGALGGRGIPVYEIDYDGKGRSQAALRSSFVAANVSSILPSSDRNHEEDAETNILRHLDPRYGDWRKVKIHYY